MLLDTLSVIPLTDVWSTSHNYVLCTHGALLLNKRWSPCASVAGAITCFLAQRPAAASFSAQLVAGLLFLACHSNLILCWSTCIKLDTHCRCSSLVFTRRRHGWWTRVTCREYGPCGCAVSSVWLVVRAIKRCDKLPPGYSY